ncbi:MAG TPA: DivIVA domain-containing protein, partial [Candidatus Limnocylindrales bacterium]
MSDYNVSFRSVLRGYDQAQVDQHVNELAQAAASSWQEATEHTRQINDLTIANAQLKSEVEGLSERARVLEEAQVEAAAPTYTGLGERIGTVLTLVDHEVNELRIRAQAGAANSRALAEEDALAIRLDAHKYARQTRSATEDEAAQILDEARQQADNLLEDARQQAESVRDDARQDAENLRDETDRQTRAREDADRQATARREEAEALYERARAKAAAAAVDFETTLAARREASAVEFAAQVTAAEQQLGTIRQRSEQARRDSDRAQQEAASKITRQLEQATARAHALVTEARAKAERIRDDSERELAAATARRDSINAEIANVRQDLAELSGATRINPRLLDVP